MLKNYQLPKKLKSKTGLRKVVDSYGDLCEKLSLGFMTWQDIGDQLNGFLRDTDELSNSLVEGFLSDLARRKLWRS